MPAGGRKEAYRGGVGAAGVEPSGAPGAWSPHTPPPW